MNFPANIIVVAGTASNSGKTSLVCALLRELTLTAPWEAIKLSRGHYRSCGKDPHACCVSGLLGEQATVRSGKAETYALGKDTGRYWDAGASNVHWVIATDQQVEAGIQIALQRVTAQNVIIEGTSVLQSLKPAFAVLAVTDKAPHKASAQAALADQKIDALYFLEKPQGENPLPSQFANLPAFDQTEITTLCAAIKQRLVSSAPESVPLPSLGRLL